MPFYADWTSERKQLVRRLWERGFTATQIAGRLDIEVTRNAIIGLVHRNRWGHGMLPKDKPRKPSPRKHATRPLPRQIPVLPEPRQPVPPEGLTFFDLREHHWRKCRNHPAIRRHPVSGRRAAAPGRICAGVGVRLGLWLWRKRPANSFY